MKKIVLLVIMLTLVLAFCGGDADKKKATLEDMKTLGSTVMDCITDRGTAPEKGDVNALIKDLIPFYAKKLPAKDHWGNEYKYTHGTTPETADKFSITSAGPDGKFGTGDDIVYEDGQFK